jgi:protein-S-isoprenylcysteine O-methyltransferase Ste14
VVRWRSTIDPYRPTTALVQSGPYRFSRNPIYVAFVLAEAGLGLAFGWWWALGLSPAVALALDVRVVRREEAYLDGKFGQAYQDYRGRVRRWL